MTFDFVHHIFLGLTMAVGFFKGLSNLWLSFSGGYRRYGEDCSSFFLLTGTLFFLLGIECLVFIIII